MKSQLALADDTEVSGSSTFADLGADSLDTVSQLDTVMWVTFLS